jgi:DnaJ-class molecular chaperone
MNAYEILECRRDSSQDEIKASYHKLLLVHHPDKQITGHIQHQIDAFLKLQSAYKLLGDPRTRSNYDSLLIQTELKQKAEDQVAAADDYTNLMLSKDFDHDELSQVYTRRCRCGDVYSLTQQTLNTLLEEIVHGQTDSPESLVVCLECNTCSIVVNLLVI